MMFICFGWPINKQQRFVCDVFFFTWLECPPIPLRRHVRQPIRIGDVRRASPLRCACARRRHFVSTGLTVIWSACAADLYSSKNSPEFYSFLVISSWWVFLNERFFPIFIFSPGLEPSLDFFLIFFFFFNVFPPLAGVPVGISGVHFVMAAQ